MYHQADQRDRMLSDVNPMIIDNQAPQTVTNSLGFGEEEDEVEFEDMVLLVSLSD